MAFLYEVYEHLINNHILEKITKQIDSFDMNNVIDMDNWDKHNLQMMWSSFPLVLW